VSSAPQKRDVVAVPKLDLNNINIDGLSKFVKNPQGFSGISQQCQSALLNIALNPEFFECVPISAIVGLVSDPDLIRSVISNPLPNIPKLQPLFDDVCAIKKCSKSYIDGVV